MGYHNNLNLNIMLYKTSRKWFLIKWFMMMLPISAVVTIFILTAFYNIFQILLAELLSSCGNVWESGSIWWIRTFKHSEELLSLWMLKPCYIIPARGLDILNRLYSSLLSLVYCRDLIVVHVSADILLPFCAIFEKIFLRLLFNERNHSSQNMPVIIFLHT